MWQSSTSTIDISIMSLSRGTVTFVFPTIRRRYNNITKVHLVTWHSLLQQYDSCIITEQYRQTHSSIATMAPSYVCPPLHHKATIISTFSSSQMKKSTLISTNQLLVSQSKSLFHTTRTYEPIDIRPLNRNIRSFHTTQWRTSDTALATTTTATESTPSVTNTTSNEMPPILWTTHRLKPEQIEKVDRIFHKILWLDLFEASMLNEIVNEKMGVSLNNKQKRQLNQLMEQRAQEAWGGASSNNNNNNGGEEVEEVEAGPVLVDMKLSSYDAASKIKVIKEVRSILNLGLKEAKEMVESAPVTLQKGMKQEMAEELKTKLESVGAKIELV